MVLISLKKCIETDYPKTVSITEVGLRDGLQFEKKRIPTAMKVAIIKDLVAAGLKSIQVASFVNPDRVPQMRDADRLVAMLPKVTGVVYNGLVLNSKGVERARNAGLTSVEISLSASDTHSQRMCHTGRVGQAQQIDSLR